MTVQPFVEFLNQQQYLDYLYDLYHNDYSSFLVEALLYESDDKHLFPLDFKRRNALDVNLMSFLICINVCKSFSPDANKLPALIEMYSHDIAALAAVHYGQPQCCHVDDLENRVIVLAAGLLADQLYTRDDIGPFSPIPFNRAESLLKKYLSGEAIDDIIISDEERNCSEQNLELNFNDVDSDDLSSEDVTSEMYVPEDSTPQGGGLEHVSPLDIEDTPTASTLDHPISYKGLEKKRSPRQRRREQFYTRLKEQKNNKTDLSRNVCGPSTTRGKNVGPVKAQGELLLQRGTADPLKNFDIPITVAKVILANPVEVKMIRDSAKFRGRRYIFDADMMHLKSFDLGDKVLITSIDGAEKWGQEFWVTNRYKTDSEMNICRLEWCGNPRYKGTIKSNHFIKFG